MDDLERVVTIVRNATQFMAGNGIPQWDDVYPGKEILQADIGNQQMYVIENAKSVAGVITLSDYEPFEYGDVSWLYSGKILVIHRLTIVPEHQGKKLASELMNFAEKEVASRCYDAIRLDVFTQNPSAIALYERRGYKQAGTVLFRKGFFFCYEKKIKDKI